MLMYVRLRLELFTRMRVEAETAEEALLIVQDALEDVAPFVPFIECDLFGDDPNTAVSFPEDLPDYEILGVYER